MRALALWDAFLTRLLTLLAERADAVDVDPTTLAATPPAPQPPPDRSWVTTELIKADPRPSSISR